MKSPTKSEILQGISLINNHRIIYYKKASEKIRELNLKTLLNNILIEYNRGESSHLHELKKPTIDPAGISPTKKSKFYRLRMEIKTILYKAYELE